MRTIAVVQARLGSHRLPGKVLKDLSGKPMLSHIVGRLRSVVNLDEVVISLPAKDRDLQDYCEAERFDYVLGSENDVLDRFMDVAHQWAGDTFVRITGDCPLIDPGWVAATVAHLGNNDYCSNVNPRTLPRGLDVEVFHRDTLYKLHRLAKTAYDREHVTTYLRETAPERFQQASISSLEDDSDLQWSVDTQEDFDRVEAIYKRLGLAERILPYDEILTAVRSW